MDQRITFDVHVSFRLSPYPVRDWCSYYTEVTGAAAVRLKNRLCVGLLLYDEGSWFRQTSFNSRFLTLNRPLKGLIVRRRTEANRSINTMIHFSPDGPQFSLVKWILHVKVKTQRVANILQQLADFFFFFFCTRVYVNADLRYRTACWWGFLEQQWERSEVSFSSCSFSLTLSLAHLLLRWTIVSSLCWYGNWLIK